MEVMTKKHKRFKDLTTKLTLKKYYKKFTPLHDKVTSRVEEIIKELIEDYTDHPPECVGCEYILAENVISKALCSLSAKLLISSRTLGREPVDFATTVDLKKNFESCLQNNINYYNDWYRDEVLNNRVLH